MYRYTVCSLRHRPRSGNSFVIMTESTTHGCEFLFKPDGTGIVSTTIPFFGKIYTTDDSKNFKWDPTTFPIATLLKDMADGKRNTIQVQNTEDDYHVKYLHDGNDGTGCDLSNITKQIMYHHIKMQIHSSTGISLAPLIQ